MYNKHPLSISRIRCVALDLNTEKFVGKISLRNPDSSLPNWRALLASYIVGRPYTLWSADHDINEIVEIHVILPNLAVALSNYRFIIGKTSSSDPNQLRDCKQNEHLDIVIWLNGVSLRCICCSNSFCHENEFLGYLHHLHVHEILVMKQKTCHIPN
jgi:hypothetical protein